MTGPRVFATPEEMLGAEGSWLGPTDWLRVDQARVDGFADVTGDHQWIHVDVARAEAGPFGGTIVHGYLTLALVNLFLPQMIDVQGSASAINVGADRLRFLSPVKTGSRIRATGEIVSVERIKGAIQSVVRVTIEIEGADRPACSVETISRYYPLV